MKWILSERFGIAGILRGDSIRAQVRREDAERLRLTARSLFRDLAVLMAEFTRTPDAARASNQFVTGLYDGLMDDPRKPGQLLPPAKSASLKKPKKAALTQAPGVSIHPYTLAVELGRSIRLATPAQALTAKIAALANTSA